MELKAVRALNLGRSGHEGVLLTLSQLIPLMQPNCPNAVIRVQGRKGLLYANNYHVVICASGKGK